MMKRSALLALSQFRVWVPSAKPSEVKLALFQVAEDEPRPDPARRRPTLTPTATTGWPDPPRAPNRRSHRCIRRPISEYDARRDRERPVIGGVSVNIKREIGPVLDMRRQRDVTA